MTLARDWFWEVLYRTERSQLPTARDTITIEPDAVLLDIGLPGMDGYEVARRLRAEFASRSVPIVALTGWGRTEDIKRARDAGFDDHLVKPVDIDALRRLLSRMRSADPRGAAITRLDEE